MSASPATLRASRKSPGSRVKQVKLQVADVANSALTERSSFSSSESPAAPSSATRLQLMLKRGSGSVVPSLAELEAEYWADPDVVARGQVELRLCDASARAPIAVLRFAGTLRPGLPTFALTADEHVLGRNELATARKRISHRHFSVRVAPDGGADGRGGHVVEDLSQNGTWLDGTRLMPGAPQPLRDGALITLARASADAEHAFTYHVVENPRSTEAAAIAGSARKSHRRLLKLERPSRSSSSSSGASPRAGAPSTPATVARTGSPSTTTGGSSNWLGGFFRSWPRTATEAEAEAEAMAAINIQRVRRGEVGRRLSKAVRAGEPITSLASAASLASSAASSSEALPPASSAWPDAFVEESETLRGDEPSPAKAAAPAPAAAELSREELEREVRALPAPPAAPVRPLSHPRATRPSRSSPPCGGARTCWRRGSARPRGERRSSSRRTRCSRSRSRCGRRDRRR